MKGMRAAGIAGLVLALAWVSAEAGAAPARETPAGRGDGRARSSLILLGTAGGPVARVARSQPASLVVIGDKRILVDCGEGTVGQLAKIGLESADIDIVFLTHMHFDHTAGLPSLLAFDWISPKAHPMVLFGPPGLAELASGSMDANDVPADVFGAIVRPRVPWRKIAVANPLDVVSPTVVYRDPSLTITAVENSHFAADSVPKRSYGTPRAYSYRFDLPDRSIVFTGDTGPSPPVTKLAAGADILVSEVIDVDAAVRDARARGATPEGIATIVAHQEREHLTPEQVGRMATTAKVKMVVLTHVAYSPDREGAGESFLNGVRAFYSGPVVLGRDLDQF